MGAVYSKGSWGSMDKCPIDEIEEKITKESNLEQKFHDS